jgi:PAS domain-containing protein
MIMISVLNKNQTSKNDSRNQPNVVSWQYALLLIILYGIVSVAVAGLLEFSRDHIGSDIFRPFAFSIWAITLALMFIGGAFGLYTVRYSVIIEGRKRVGRFVEAMDYFQDGLLVLDQSGKIIAQNPMAQKYFEANLESENSFLHDVFPSLSQEQLDLLLNKDTVAEIEQKIVIYGHETEQYYRFRSQINEQLRLIIVSDITEPNKRKILNRQVAELSLISQISQGVANDLNNLLCDIGVHTSLLGKLCEDIPEKTESVKSIENSVNRGIMLSDQLLKIADAKLDSQSSTTAPEYLDFVVGTLKNSLNDDWNIAVENNVKNLTITIDRTQLERIIINLALILVDTMSEAGILQIAVNGLNDKSPYAMEIVLFVSSENDKVSSDVSLKTDQNTIFRTPGAIESVISMLLHNINGKLESFSTSTKAYYKISLPGVSRHTLFSQKRNHAMDEENMQDLHAFFESKKILLYITESEQEIGRIFADYGADVRKADDIVATLTALDEKQSHDCLIINEELINQDGDGLLTAIRRLHDDLPIVIISSDPSEGKTCSIPHAVYLYEESNMSDVLKLVKDICS